MWLCEWHQLHVFVNPKRQNVRLPNNSNCHFECGRQPSDEPEDETYRMRIYNTFLLHIRHNLLQYFFFTFSGLKIAAWWSNSKANNELLLFCCLALRPIARFCRNAGGGHLVNMSYGRTGRERRLRECAGKEYFIRMWSVWIRSLVVILLDRMAAVCHTCSMWCILSCLVDLLNRIVYSLRFFFCAHFTNGSAISTNFIWSEWKKTPSFHMLFV